jgi:hypothetical protein
MASANSSSIAPRRRLASRLFGKNLMVAGFGRCHSTHQKMQAANPQSIHRALFCRYRAHLFPFRSVVVVTEREAAMSDAIIKVGDGRGFVVTQQRYAGGVERIIITAAHCLPHVPPCHPARYIEEETYQHLLGPLEGECSVWARCLFVDPVADIAVLGSPDGQDLYDQANAYDRLVDDVTPFTVADAPAQGTEVLTLPPASIYVTTQGTEELCTVGEHQISTRTPGKGRARVLSLEGRWLDGEVERRGGWLAFEPEEHFVGGMSGSPIVDAVTGAAIGVCSTGIMSPVIVDSLSAQLMRSILAHPEMVSA